MPNLFRSFWKTKKTPLDKVLADYELPSFRSSLCTVLSMLRKPESSLEEIAVHIEMDPGMHVKILKSVNSVAFGLTRKVADISHAVVLLGRSRLESAALSVAIKDVLPKAKSPAFNESHFWLAASRRASLARLLARHLHPSTQALSFTAGLLQDMAVPILISVLGDKYAELYKAWTTSPATELHKLEQDALGYDHAGLGAAMAEAWELPEILATAIKAHPVPVEVCDANTAVQIVSLIRDNPNDPGTEQIVRLCEEKLGLPCAKTESYINEAFENAAEFAKAIQ